MENVLISNEKNFEEIKKKFQKDGLSGIHVLADFDKTLLKAFVDGEPVASVLSILYNQNYLTPDYGKAARELHKKYHAIEIDLKIPRKERQKAMQEWWEKHFDLLIKSRLNKKDIRAGVNSGKIIFREGFLEFIDFLKNKDIPLVIISSTGLGKDSIEMCFERENRMYENIYIISNSFKWDKNGYAASVRNPIIHALNKDEATIKDFPKIFEKIKDRKNVMLLGDSIDDIGMVAGFKYDNIIKIGFLNENIEENLKNYKKVFDVLITNDSSLDFINYFLKEISK